MWHWKENWNVQYDPRGNVVADAVLPDQKNWVEGMRGNIVARFMSKADIHGITKQDVIINPGECAVFIKDGKIDDVMTQTRMKDVGGGFMNWLSSKMSMGEDVSMLFVDTTPFDMDFPVQAQSKDHQKVQGKATIRVQLTEGNASKIINLINKCPIKTDRVPGVLWDSMRRNHVLTSDVLGDMLRDELTALVFQPQCAQLNAAEYYGNVQAIKDFEVALNVELRKTFEMNGMTLIKSFTNWQANAYDELMQYRQQWFTYVQRYDSQKEAQSLAQLSDMQRDHAIQKKKQENYWDTQFGDLNAQEAMKTAALKADVERGDLTVDAQSRQGVRLTEGQVASQRLRQGAEADGIRTVGNAQIDLEQRRLQQAMDAKRQLDEMKIKKFQEMELKQKQVDQDFKERQMSMQTGSMERLMSKALETGAADSKSLQEMLRQQTLSKMADRESDKVQAMANAEASRSNIDAYRTGQEQDRQYQTTVLQRGADMMQAGKQNVPQTLVTGGGGVGAGTGGTPVLLSVASGQGGPKGCPSCQEPVEAGWDECPACGAKLAVSGGKAGVCPGCGSAVKPNWKKCPSCKTSLA